MSRRRRFEPWPWMMAALLLFMVSVSVGFYVVAATHPDPEVVHDAYAAGLEYNARVRAEREASER